MIPRSEVPRGAPFNQVANEETGEAANGPFQPGEGPEAYVSTLSPTTHGN